MRIKLTLFIPNKKDRGYEPEIMNFKGNYAIETLLIKVAEKFFGCKVSRQIEDILRTKKEDGE